jgi:diaminopimelate epimerase
MELRNADGGIAEMSGNGVRCLAQAAVDAGLVSESTLVVRTLAGPRRVKIVPGEEYGTADVSVDMGAAQLGAGEADQRLADVFPGSGGRARTVCMGNPHLVILLPDLLGVDLARAGAAAQDVYDGGINVELIAPAPISDELVMRVWERGVGETLACGTGSCAAAAAAREWGVVGDRVRVHNPGGTLDVGLNGSRASLSGLVRRVCAVEVEVP